MREYIGAAIKSVLGQTYGEWELLIVDDASTDGTGKAIIVRPGLEGWNKHSLNMNLEEMLVAIGEPVKRWRRK